MKTPNALNAPLAVLVALTCSTGTFASDERLGRKLMASNDGEVVSAAIAVFANWSVLSPPVRLHGTWSVSRIPNDRVQGGTSTEELVEAHAGGGGSELPALVVECSDSVHTRGDSYDGPLDLFAPLPATKNLISVVDEAEPRERCDAANDYPENLFENYAPKELAHGQGNSASIPLDFEWRCWGAVTFSLPGYCGADDEVALVLLEVSQAVPHSILRAPYKVAILLWRDSDGDWIGRSLRTFGSEHFSSD